MENQIQVLKQANLCGKQFTVYGTPDEPLFLAKDVALWIQHSNVSKMIQSIDKEEVTNYSLGGLQGVCNFLTEDGLYEVLMQSRKPIAKEFKKGVKNILKTIRKTGGYIATTPEMSDEEIMARALIVANEAIKRKDEKIKALEQLNENNEQVINSQRKEIEKAIPKVKYYEETLQSVNTYTTTQIAKELGYNSANILHGLLKNAGIIYNQSGVWMLKVPYSGWRLHNARTHTFTRNDGSVGSSTQTVWTERGRYFIAQLHKFAFDVKLTIKYIQGNGK